MFQGSKTLKRRNESNNYSERPEISANGGTVSDESDVGFTLVAGFGVTVFLKDSNGNGLAGGTAEYYDAGWQTAGTTDQNGLLTVPVITLKPYTFRMAYSGKSADLSLPTLWWSSKPGKSFPSTAPVPIITPEDGRRLAVVWNYYLSVLHSGSTTVRQTPRMQSPREPPRTFISHGKILFNSPLTLYRRTKR